jgi:hypothetical protein
LLLANCFARDGMSIEEEVRFALVAVFLQVPILIISLLD